MPKPVSPEQRYKQVDAVIELIEAGNSERSACETVGINRHTFRQAIPRHNLAAQYMRALEALAHEQVDKIDSAINDMRTGKIDSNQARVEIDARKWLACKFLPRLYGDRVQQVHTGADGGAVQVQQVSPLDEIEQRLQRLSEREVQPATTTVGRVVN